MPFTFTSEQKNKIRSILQGAGDVSSLSPEERHLLVLHWNWDDGQKEINWIIDQPDTDRGTALLIYWLISPRYLHQFATVQEVPEELIASYELMRKIEDNLEATFYSGEKIAIDPASHQGTDFTREYFNIEPAYHFPEIVFRPTEGEVMEAITLSSENIWRIHPVDENNQKKIERQIQKGHQLLAEHYPVLTETSKPEAIAAAIQAISNSFRKGEDRKFTAKERQLFKALDYLLAEQAVRAFGWQWYMYEIREQVLDFDNPVIVSPDRDYFWGNLGLFLQRVSKIGGELQFVEDLFEAMRNIDEFKEKQYKQRAEWYPDSSEEEIQNMPRNLPDGLTEVSHLKETIWE